MTIVRCQKCRIVVLDSYENGKHEVQCGECGTRYAIELSNGQAVSQEIIKNNVGKRK